MICCQSPTLIWAKYIFSLTIVDISWHGGLAADFWVTKMLPSDARQDCPSKPCIAQSFNFKQNVRPLTSQNKIGQIRYTLNHFKWTKKEYGNSAPSPASISRPFPWTLVSDILKTWMWRSVTVCWCGYSSSTCRLHLVLLRLPWATQSSIQENPAPEEGNLRTDLSTVVV